MESLKNRHAFHAQEGKAPHSFEEELVARVGWFVRLRWFPAGAALLVAILAHRLGRPHLQAWSSWRITSFSSSGCYL
jgi:hypothetical protein